MKLAPLHLSLLQPALQDLGRAEEEGDRVPLFRIVQGPLALVGFNAATTLEGQVRLLHRRGR